MGEKRSVREKGDLWNAAIIEENVLFVCFFLPWTVRTAEVFWSPHTHVYSPVSSTSRSRINSSADVSSCLILYLSLGLSVLSPFFHSTGTPTLLSSQCSVAVAPSVASLFFKPSLKNAGKAERQQYEQWDVMLQRVKIKLWCLISLFLLILNWFINTRTYIVNSVCETIWGMKSLQKDLLLAVTCRDILHVLSHKPTEVENPFFPVKFQRKKIIWNFWKKMVFSHEVLKRSERRIFTMLSQT